MEFVMMKTVLVTVIAAGLLAVVACSGGSPSNNSETKVDTTMPATVPVALKVSGMT